MSQREKIVALCDEAGLELMADIADVITNRENVTPLDVRRFFEQTGVYELYETFIGPAIDRLENAIPRAHSKVAHGRCPVCGHYGDDCTGKEE